jgi:hypothetical protein
MGSGEPLSRLILNDGQCYSSPGTSLAVVRGAFTSNSWLGRIRLFFRTFGKSEGWKKVSEMGRTLNQIISERPVERQERIDSLYREMKGQVEGLSELRRIAGKAQVDIAAALNIKQPSVSKIEKQADMYLSTLRSYVEAVGGELELVVKLPQRPAFRLRRLGDALEESANAAKPAVRRRK